jgi:hypothetical protein
LATAARLAKQVNIFGHYWPPIPTSNIVQGFPGCFVSDHMMGLVHHYLSDPPPFRKGSQDTNDVFTNEVGRHY